MSNQPFRTIAPSDYPIHQIRINLYVTMIIMVLVPNIPGRTAPLLGVVEGNAGLSGFALLLTAIAYTAHGGQLSLYHAIFIIHILLFTGITVVPAGTDTFFCTVSLLMSFISRPLPP